MGKEERCCLISLCPQVSVKWCKYIFFLSLPRERLCLCGSENPPNNTNDKHGGERVKCMIVLTVGVTAKWCPEDIVISSLNPSPYCIGSLYEQEMSHVVSDGIHSRGSLVLWEPVGRKQPWKWVLPSAFLFSCIHYHGKFVELKVWGLTFVPCARLTSHVNFERITISRNINTDQF